MIKKAFIVRFFADGGFRVEGPFVPAQVQRLINSGECYRWLGDWALFAVWGINPRDILADLAMLSTDINTIARRRARKRYQPLRANHYRAQHNRHVRI